MEEAAVQGRVSIDSQYFYPGVKGIVIYSRFFFSSQVAHWAGDNCHSMTKVYEVLGNFVVAGAAGFVDCGKCLVYEKDMHVSKKYLLGNNHKNLRVQWKSPECDEPEWET